MMKRIFSALAALSVVLCLSMGLTGCCCPSGAFEEIMDELALEDIVEEIVWELEDALDY